MLLKTHLAIGVFAIILFLQHVNSKVVFILIALVATVLPDMDTAFSTLGKNRFFRIMQFFVRHRGLIHSFSICVIISILAAIIYPPLAFGFFLGYSLHILADSFTKEGIVPFWPYPKRIAGRFKTGGMTENIIFIVFLIVDILFAFSKVI